MSVGSTLLKLQELDLSLERDRKALAEMPEIAELAKKRRAYQKLKADATKLYAQRKDLETYLKELDDQEMDANDDIRIAQRNVDSSDYRSVQQLELELSDLAKKLERIAFDRRDYEAKLADLKKKGDYLAEYTAKFEASVIADTKRAREKAGSLKDAIEASERQRAALLNTLDAGTRSSYEAAAKRFRGLGVERLEGNVPTVCRMTLQASSLDALKHAGDVAECPYCHRILILSEDGDE
ncbi:hypothetical protein H6A35_05000 [Collinsella tanakaei]|nr:hypothetical protein [Collinsella tanakaei]